MEPSWVFWILLLFLWNSNASSNPKKLTAVIGKDCELPCHGNPAETVKVLRWCIQEPSYLIFYRDGNLLDDGQDPHFSNRVQLRDPEFQKTGNLSVVLKNVTTQDSGRYSCFAQFETSGGIQEISQDIELTVTETDEKPTDKLFYGVVAALLTLPVVIICMGVIYFYRKRNFKKRNDEKPKTPSEDELLPQM